MDISLLFILASVIVVSLVSLIGIVSLSVNESRLKSFLLYLVSLSAGALLGDAFIHLIPEAAEDGFTLSVSFAILAGLAIFFLIEAWIHWHHHSVECEHPKHGEKKPKPFVWTNLIGDGIHNFVDGLVIAASYVVSFPVGVATTLAVILHEIPQEIADFGVLLHGGLSKKKALEYNYLSAILAIIGGIVGYFLTSLNGLLSLVVPFAAGTFIYIAAADLIPEIHQREKAWQRRMLHFLMFLIGIGLMMGLLLLE